MRRLLLAVIVLSLTAAHAQAGPLTICFKKQLVRLNTKLDGCVVDFTNNHGADHRFWSEALCAKREMYVYLPPGYDPALRYPVMIWMHGFIQDEKDFLEIVPLFDRAIASGCLPPMIIAAPDGSITGKPSILHGGSFYLNSDAGRYEDYLVVDVWNLLLSNFSIRPEREAHVLAGASMGGFAAYNLGIKHRDCFKIVVGIMPPLNLRYCDCHGRYFSDFDPCCLGIQERYRPHSTVGNFYGVIHIEEKRLIKPLFGSEGRAAIFSIARENPVEMLETYDVKPGELAMFAGYGCKDEFNVGAQVESFAFFARKRGIEPFVIAIPNGRHNTPTGFKMLPEFESWITPFIKAYAPPLNLIQPCQP